MTDQKRTENETAGDDSSQQDSTDAVTDITETETSADRRDDVEDAEFEEIGASAQGEKPPLDGSDTPDSDEPVSEAETGTTDPDGVDSADPGEAATQPESAEALVPDAAADPEVTVDAGGADVVEPLDDDVDSADPDANQDTEKAPWSDEWSAPSSVDTPPPADANASVDEATDQPVAPAPEDIDTTGSSSVAPAAVAAAAAAEPLREIVRESVVEKQGSVVPGLIAGLIGGIAVVFGAPYVVPREWLPPPDTSAIDAQFGQLRTEIESATAKSTAVAGDLAEARQTLASKSELEALSGTLSSVQEAQTGLTSNIQGVTAAVSDVSGETDDLASQLAEVSGQIADLSPRIDALEPRLADLEPRIDALEPRINDLERRPIAESPDPTAVSAVQSYGREVEALRTEYGQNVAELRDRFAAEVESLETKYSEEVETLRSGYDTQVAALQADVSAQRQQADDILQEAIRQATEAREEAAALTEQAAATARRAAEEKALAELQTALNTGAPFAEALAVLEATGPTEALSAVAEAGVDTLAELQADFPPLAREALGRAREDLSGNSASERGLAFLQRQLGVRSLAPREGDSADAVLSRAEAAVREARLSDAVAELDALTDSAKAVMQDWIARAQARAAALSAANDLAAGLTPN